MRLPGLDDSVARSLGENTPTASSSIPTTVKASSVTPKTSPERSCVDAISQFTTVGV